MKTEFEKPIMSIETVGVDPISTSNTQQTSAFNDVWTPWLDL